MADFGSGQGGVQSSDSTVASARESGVPVTGFADSPELPNDMDSPNGGPGPGVPANNWKIK